MLQKLLDEIRQGRVQEVSELAARLDTTPQMVEILLEHLQRSGYLRLYSGCESSCQGCALKNSCTGTNNPGVKLWSLVE
ncbi:MAG: hypothetical protein JXB15_16430 [Anaerolineales bacterium]|nr:hypothetical protein [Anaerolineales bacterium]